MSPDSLQLKEVSMNQFILNKGLLALLAFIAFALICIQLGIAEVAEQVRTTEERTCKAGELIESDGHVALKLNCGGEDRQTSDGAVIVSYLKNPGDLTCRVHSSGLDNCDERK